MDNIKLSRLDIDYEKLLDELKTIIPNLTDDWRDLSEGDLGMFLIKIYAAIKDLQNYQFDRQVGEFYLPTVTQRQNLISLTKPFGYHLKSFKSSKIAITLTVGSSITPGTTLTLVDESGREIPFTYLGKDGDHVSSTWYLYQGELKSFGSLTTPLGQCSDTNGNLVNSIDAIAISDANDSVAIDGTSIVIASPSSSPVEFTEVESFVDGITQYSGNSDSYAYIYKLYVDRDNKTYLQFFDRTISINGSSLMDNLVQINYLVTSGSAGRVSAGSILTGIDVGSHDSLSATVTEIVRIGQDPESVDSAKENFQQYLRGLDRVVTLDDYDYLISNYILSGAAGSLANCDMCAVCTVDKYKNTIASVSKHISDLDGHLTNYMVISYALAAVRGSYVDSSDYVPIIKWPDDPYNQAAIALLNSKRMVGLYCYSSYLSDELSDYGEVGLHRFKIDLTYSSRSYVDESLIKKAISDAFSLENSFGRTVTVADVYNVVRELYPSITIDVVNGINLYTSTDAYDPVDDCYKNTGSYSTTPVKSVSVAYNIALVYGGCTLHSS